MLGNETAVAALALLITQQLGRDNDSVYMASLSFNNSTPRVIARLQSDTIVEANDGTFLQDCWQRVLEVVAKSPSEVGNGMVLLNVIERKIVHVSLY